MKADATVMIHVEHTMSFTPIKYNNPFLKKEK